MSLIYRPIFLPPVSKEGISLERNDQFIACFTGKDYSLEENDRLSLMHMHTKGPNHKIVYRQLY